MANAVESGIKSVRAHFIRETAGSEGSTPADPDWLRFSDTIKRITEQPNANTHPQRGVGNVDVGSFLKGPEDHTLSIEYELQKWIASGGDAAADGLLRTSDGSIPNTHSYLSRQNLITGGVLGAGRRIYSHGVGGRIGNVQLSGDPSNGEPLKVTLQYVFEKVRSYVIEQPASTGVVTVRSTSASDTTQSVTIENEGAGVSETIELNGTTPVAGLTNFADIDSISLDAECEGDVVIEHTSEDICTILGQTSNGGFEGDLGVPALGSGSFEATLGTAYEFIVGSSVLRGGAALESNATIRTLTVSVENNLDIHPRLDSLRRRIFEGIRDIQAVASLFSEIGSHESFVQHIKATASDLVWTTVSGSITVTGATLTTPGGRTYEEGAAVMQRGNTFTGKGLTIASA